MPVLQKVTYPNNISGLYSWIDNNDLQIYPSGRTYNSTTTYSASTLYDKSGNGNNMIPFTGSGISSFTTKETNNGNTVLRNNMCWSLPFSSTANTEYTMFYVTAFKDLWNVSTLGSDAGGNLYELIYTQSNKSVFFQINNVQFRSTTGTTELNQLFLVTTRVRGTNVSTAYVRFNSKEIKISNGNSLPAFNNIIINRRSFFSGNYGLSDFAEFIIYNRYLSTEEVARIERYLMWKWKITERL